MGFVTMVYDTLLVQIEGAGMTGISMLIDELFNFF